MMLALSMLAVLPAARAQAQGSPAQPLQEEPDVTALAKTTQNPVGDLISLPFQFNFNGGGGLEDATFFNLNFQPVVPFKLSEGWNVIARTIVPLNSVPTASDVSYRGVGDIQEQIFVTPARPGRLIWGVGPALWLPTSTIPPQRTGSWGLGPTFVALTMTGPWVIGGLVTQYWTYADSGEDPEVDLFATQPFVNFNFGKGWALAYAPLITANWDADEEWTVPLGGGISRTTVFNGRPMTLGAQYYYNVVHPDDAASYQLRLQVALLYPKKN